MMTFLLFALGSVMSTSTDKIPLCKNGQSTKCGLGFNEEKGATKMSVKDCYAPSGDDCPVEFTEEEVNKKTWTKTSERYAYLDKRQEQAIKDHKCVRCVDGGASMKQSGASGNAFLAFGNVLLLVLL